MFSVYSKLCGFGEFVNQSNPCAMCTKDAVCVIIDVSAVSSLSSNAL